MACNLTIYLITDGHCMIPSAVWAELHIKGNVWYHSSLQMCVFSPLFSSACTQVPLCQWSPKCQLNSPFQPSCLPARGGSECIGMRLFCLLWWGQACVQFALLLKEESAGSLYPWEATCSVLFWLTHVCQIVTSSQRGGFSHVPVGWVFTLSQCR